ncbi:hypothetical protein BDM02DRAFT_2524669 [Thelephora ganbajun]|uniref:Uncharacterized protein n=1 Tax=Thelephora ganbajun TaxID=370292 RepID=A0ACB6YY38_THEGA|nr:hypothetical protein BDM02DRAFT_2524669 [Thelephora ganbajun]
MPIKRQAVSSSPLPIISPELRRPPDSTLSPPMRLGRLRPRLASRVGGPETLNVYTAGFTSGAIGLLGYATFPDGYADASKLGGVIILYSFIPGGISAPYNLGRTLTREAGHWLELYHTFQSGCTGDGNSIADTPSEASPAYGCPIGRDTCTNDNPPDP